MRLRFRGLCACGWRDEWREGLVAAIEANEVHDELCDGELWIDGTARKKTNLTLTGP